MLNQKSIRLRFNFYLSDPFRVRRIFRTKRVNQVFYAQIKQSKNKIYTSQTEFFFLSFSLSINRNALKSNFIRKSEKIFDECFFWEIRTKIDCVANEILSIFRTKNLITVRVYMWTGIKPSIKHEESQDEKRRKERKNTHRNRIERKITNPGKRKVKASFID